jgi:hypothetical protein
MTAYAELQITSNFSFLRGGSHPEELVLRAAECGLAAIALTDRNTLAGVVRAHVAAREVGIRFVVGARLDLMPGNRPDLPVATESPADSAGSLPDTFGFGRDARQPLLETADIAPGHDMALRVEAGGNGEEAATAASCEDDGKALASPVPMQATMAMPFGGEGRGIPSQARHIRTRVTVRRQSSRPPHQTRKQTKTVRHLPEVRRRPFLGRNRSSRPPPVRHIRTRISFRQQSLHSLHQARGQAKAVRSTTC